MNLIQSSLRKPITVIVVVIGVVLAGIIAATKINIDIFPNINLPTIYVSQPYGGMSPQQMEGFVSTNYQNLYLYVSGIKSIETNNIEGLSLLKLSFYDGTNMAQAAAEVTSLTNRAFAEMPPGTPPPIIIRFDASTLPVGQLTISSSKRSNNELQDLASLYVRPNFSKIAGLTSPPPIGGNARTVVINVDPDLMRSHGVTADQITAAIKDNNHISPAGTVSIGRTSYLTPSNTVLNKVKDFEKIPLLYQNGATIYLKDVARVVDGADITTGFAYINGKRAIYIPVIKASSASTWSVVQDLKKAIPNMQSLLPPDVSLKFEFDESVYVINAVKSLISEGVTGAILAGLMVLLFLRDKRSAFIVVVNIPLSVIIGTLVLKLFGQTLNIMTLSGLALAIGILVDESTVTIENIHRHMEMGKKKARAVADACEEIALPKLLILLSILAVFVPAFFMTGVPQGMFLPLSLAVGFSMIAAFLLSQTLVPVLANWVLKVPEHHEEKPKAADQPNRFDRFKAACVQIVKWMMSRSRASVALYVAISFIIVGFSVSIIGKDILPKLNSGQFQVRIRAPQGTRLEQTEKTMLEAQQVLYQTVGKNNVDIISAFAGQHPSSFPTLPVILFMSSSNEIVMQVNLSDNYKENIQDVKENLRKALHKAMPDVTLSFEPIDLTSKIMSQGSSTPVEIAVIGKDITQGQQYADILIAQLKQVPFLRDVQLKEQLKSPAIHINIDRDKVTQMGLTMTQVSNCITQATSSSRFTDKILWLDQTNANSYNVQVEIPQPDMGSLDDLAEVPIFKNSARPVLGDVCTFNMQPIVGEYDRKGATRYLSIIANIYNKDLGSASAAVNKILKNSNTPPRGISVEVRGLTILLDQTLASLQSGLLITIIVLLLMLSANYQSFRLGFTVITAIPGVLVGSLLILLATGSSLNLQSYMGIIMSVGVSVSNAILLISNAEEIRKSGKDAMESAIEAMELRLRPILMTTIAMIAGMIPMATGLGEAGGQTAPLGRAVIGGLIASTFVSLFILPVIFYLVQQKSTTNSVSLDPDDQLSVYFDPKNS
ncbi:efflux RND transporter permease subunit [Mucilaginibacter rubeus]|uniref:Efflux RND transporter permease subunit n=1 Tax=Mucilaginibacter rubeus TaxID=2027860 RepID=A0A5C1I968_9SPHI|nr:efflux RND transporter permease subunit [Mucilaginibacter rubeus]QEM14236.1 efflux RND transporter permease subunit [Mucilaginibacter rubeus]